MLAGMARIFPAGGFWLPAMLIVAAVALPGCTSDELPRQARVPGRDDQRPPCGGGARRCRGQGAGGAQSRSGQGPVRRLRRRPGARTAGRRLPGHFRRRRLGRVRRRRSQGLGKGAARGDRPPDLRCGHRRQHRCAHRALRFPRRRSVDRHDRLDVPQSEGRLDEAARAARLHLWRRVLRGYSRLGDGGSQHPRPGHDAPHRRCG